MSAVLETPFRFHPLAPDFVADPFPILKRLQREAPVHRSELGFWLLTRYDDVVTVLRDGDSFGSAATPERIRARVGQGAAFAYLSRRMVGLDPPGHTRLRAPLSKPFSGRSLESLRPRVAAMARELFDRRPDGRRMDFMRMVAHPLPSLVMCELLGVPEEDAPQLGAWSEDLSFLIASAIEPRRLAKAETSVAAFLDYARALVRERRDAGDAGEADLIGALCAARYDGQKLPDDDIAGTILFMFSAGHQTSRDVMGSGLVALMRQPEQWRRLVAEPGLHASAAEECLRYEPAVTMTSRMAYRDVVIGATQIRAGEQVTVSLAAANRDPGHFANPDRLDVARADNRHLTFGGGIHHCLGAALARMEIQVVLAMLAELCPGMELESGRIEWRKTAALRGPVAVSVAW